MGQPLVVARVGADKDGAPVEKFRRSGWFTTTRQTTNLVGVSRGELEDEEGGEGDAATEMVFVKTPATAGRSMREQQVIAKIRYRFRRLRYCIM